VLAEGLEVTGAALDNGLLNVDLERPPATSRVRRIEIRDLEGSGRVAGDRG
jgi:HSP20 family molecular chaperone IbpA